MLGLILNDQCGGRGTKRGTRSKGRGSLFQAIVLWRDTNSNASSSDTYDLLYELHPPVSYDTFFLKSVGSRNINQRGSIDDQGITPWCLSISRVLGELSPRYYTANITNNQYTVLSHPLLLVDALSGPHTIA